MKRCVGRLSGIDPFFEAKRFRKDTYRFVFLAFLYFSGVPGHWTLSSTDSLIFLQVEEVLILVCLSKMKNNKK